MSFYGKLAVFWAVVAATIWLVARFSSSPMARLALSWHGPVPSPGELRSHLLFRWCLYSLGWLAQIALVAACGYGAAWLHPPFTEATLFLAI